MNRRRIAGLTLASVVITAGLFFWPLFSVLELVKTADGEIKFCARVGPGEEFELSYLHSVNRRLVHDTLRAESDHLVIFRSRFDSFGAGMPDATTGDGTLTVEKNGSLVWTVNRPMPEITLRVGRVAEQALQCKGRQIRLADLAEPGSALTLRVRSASGFNLIGKRCIS